MSSFCMYFKSFVSHMINTSYDFITDLKTEEYFTLYKTIHPSNTTCKSHVFNLFSALIFILTYLLVVTHIYVIINNKIL